MGNQAVQLSGSIPLFTWMGREIANTQDPDLPPHRAEELVRKHRQDYPFACLRRGPTGQYNCHGMTFANRRTWIGDPQDVQKFLEDDGYRQIKASDAQEGDIVVHYDVGEISHTGLVISVVQEDRIIGGQAVKVLSKWAQGGEYLHAVTDRPYAEQKLTYWTDRE